MVKRYKQFDELVVDDFEVDTWNHPLHKHNHFELIFIDRGTGRHLLNQQEIPYQQGDLFLLGPEDEHEFEVTIRTRFMYFKFTKPYLSRRGDVHLPEHWDHQMEVLLYSPKRKGGTLLEPDTDQELIRQLMYAIVQEHHHKKYGSKQIIFQLFTTIILVIQRHFKNRPLPEQSGITERLLEYVDMHIYNPSKLTLQQMAEHFHYSGHYIGPLFRDKVGCSLREYVRDYRYRLIQQRLQYGQVSVKQLASEFGFVDASHVYKFLRSYEEKDESLQS